MIEHLLRNWLRKHRVKANDRRREAEARAELIAARKEYTSAQAAIQAVNPRDDRGYGQALMVLMRANNVKMEAEWKAGLWSSQGPSTPTPVRREQVSRSPAVSVSR